MTALAFAVNVAEVAPAGTVSDAGASSAGLFEVSVTDAPPEGAGPLRITLHVVGPLDARLDGLQATEFGITDGAVGAGAAKVITAFCAPPLSVAVIVPLWLALTLAALAVNDAEVDPAATVIDDGTVSTELLLLSDTVAPPLDAAPFSETEHVEVAGVTNEAGLQEKRLTVAGVKTEMAPPVPVAVIISPLDDEAKVLVNPKFRVPLVAETVTLTAANTPSGIAVWFIPEAIQTYPVLVGEQVSDLLLVVREDPAATVTADTPAAGRVSAHCTLAGPAEPLIESCKVAVVPGVIEVEDNVRTAVCPEIS